MAAFVVHYGTLAAQEHLSYLALLLAKRLQLRALKPYGVNERHKCVFAREVMNNLSQYDGKSGGLMRALFDIVDIINCPNLIADQERSEQKAG